ncbi:DUF3829 domain-containing protein [Pseudomonas sp. FP2309]|jgi:hypothetical protein|uniref:DUF3829 domain-containing protein n=1 Tax=Pseudomonas sp. FP2309 TaxID=2954091 RepID=UPI0027374789|nr:DUF3829 domain-containing protein [Pseudomonas sp. FP2309]WLH66203.1 DUF3829 domain-containing protein [Pseudomonas sp. FP2309]
MNPKWLLPISLALGLGLLGVAGATKPLQKVQLWLDQRDSPFTAKASALAPIIDCVNRVDRDTRLAYYHSQAPQAQMSTGDTFGDDSEPVPRLIQAAVCSPLFTLKLERLEPGSRLIGLASVYAYRLNKFTALADSVTPMPSRNLSTDTQQMVADVMNKHLQGEVAGAGEAYLQVSTQLRSQLEREDLEVRPAQLALLQARFGRDLQWHLLNYMIAARQAVRQIEQGVRDANLTPHQLADLTEAVREASEDSRRFMNAMPKTRPDERVAYLWYNTKASADAYLDALRTLHQHWLEHAPPQQLSDDYALVTHRYDVLLSFYNRYARNTF